jgi:hypothetical protein
LKQLGIRDVIGIDKIFPSLKSDGLIEAQNLLAPLQPFS